MGAPGLFDCDLMGFLADMNAGGVDESSEDEGKLHAGRWSLSVLGNEVEGYASSPLPSADVAQVFSPSLHMPFLWELQQDGECQMAGPCN